jgi:hypothetical protein
MKSLWIKRYRHALAAIATSMACALLLMLVLLFAKQEASPWLSPHMQWVVFIPVFVMGLIPLTQLVFFAYFYLYEHTEARQKGRRRYLLLPVNFFELYLHRLQAGTLLLGSYYLVIMLFYALLSSLLKGFSLSQTIPLCLQLGTGFLGTQIGYLSLVVLLSMLLPPTRIWGAIQLLAGLLLIPVHELLPCSTAFGFAKASLELIQRPMAELLPPYLITSLLYLMACTAIAYFKRKTLFQLYTR